MQRKKSKLKLAHENEQVIINKVNRMIEELGAHTEPLCASLNGLQGLFDEIRNMPTSKKLECDEMKTVRLNWKEQTEKIESDYTVAAVKSTGVGAIGIGAGTAVASLAPTAAMGIATTFGVASTGTAISTLSGAAATNAALAWLGGGALAVGGGGMAAGNALLALAGPIGWAIAGVSILASGLAFFKTWNDKKQIEDIFVSISERNIKSYKLALLELKERMSKIDRENGLITDAIDKLKLFGLDYNAMTEAQQYELGAYVNLLNASTQLLVNPILRLQPKLSEQDLDEYLSYRYESSGQMIQTELKPVVLMLSNLLYKIELDGKTKKLLYKTFASNKEMLKGLGINKQIFSEEVMDIVDDALSYSCSSSKQAT